LIEEELVSEELLENIALKTLSDDDDDEDLMPIDDVGVTLQSELDDLGNLQLFPDVDGSFPNNLDDSYESDLNKGNDILQ